MSARNSSNTSSKCTGRGRISVPSIQSRKGDVPIVCLTAYTAPMAELIDQHADLILVGDSVGMVVHGLDSTLDVTMEMMIMHGQAVRRGAKRALVVVDMPFGSYEESPEVAYRNAVRLIKETGCEAVKLEGGAYMADTIAFLTERGIPVMAHVGLMPQAKNVAGGFKVVGRRQTEWARIEEDARRVAEAGAFAVVLEGIAEPLAERITQAVNIPTIGIGASHLCDGQILVTDDMLGMFQKTPRFVKRYADMRLDISEGLEAYADDVRARRFPSEKYTYSMLESRPELVVSNPAQELR